MFSVHRDESWEHWPCLVFTTTRIQAGASPYTLRVGGYLLKG